MRIEYIVETYKYPNIFDKKVTFLLIKAEAFCQDGTDFFVKDVYFAKLLRESSNKPITDLMLMNALNRTCRIFCNLILKINDQFWGSSMKVAVTKDIYPEYKFYGKALDIFNKDITEYNIIERSYGTLITNNDYIAKILLEDNFVEEGFAI